MKRLHAEVAVSAQNLSRQMSRQVGPLVVRESVCFDIIWRQIVLAAVPLLKISHYQLAGITLHKLQRCYDSLLNGRQIVGTCYAKKKYIYIYMA